LGDPIIDVDVVFILICELQSDFGEFLCNQLFILRGPCSRRAHLMKSVYFICGNNWWF